MIDPSERFIEAAVRPLADNAELQMMAAQELRATLENAPEAAAGASLDEATEKLEKAPPKEHWKVILYTAALLATILAAIPVGRDYLRIQLAAWTLYWDFDSPLVALPRPPFGSDAVQRVPQLYGPLTSSERLLLFGDLSQPTREESKRQLWESSPQDPALFADYARAFTSKSKLSADFLATADRLAPENAWFRYFKASITANKSVEQVEVPYRVLKITPNTPRFRILDPAAHAEAIRIFEEASRLPVSNSYYEELLLRRLDLIPPGDDLVGRDLAKAYLESMDWKGFGSGKMLFRSISAHAEELAATGDQERFRSLAEAWEILARRAIEDRGMAPYSFESAAHLARAAQTLGMDSLAERYTRLDKTIRQRSRECDFRKLQLAQQWKDLGDSADPILYSGARVEHPPELQRSDLMPGIMAKQAGWQRVASAAGGAVMLAFLLIAAVSRFYRGRQVRSLSASLVKVLDSSDYRKIVIGGVIIPFLLHFLVEWQLPTTFASSVKHVEASTLLRFAALTAAIVCLPALLTSNRFDLLLGRLGWSKPAASAVTVTSVMTATTAAASVFTEFDPVRILGWTVVIGHLGVALITLTLCVATCLRNEAVSNVTWARSLLPAYATGLLIFALLVPIHHARERYWTKRNVLTKIEPGIPAANRYLYEIEQIERKELLEILDAKP